MHFKRLLQDLLFPVMHKKRALTLITLISTLLKTKRLSLTALGRAMASGIKQRSGIRIVDRFFGNKKLIGELEAIQSAIARKIIGMRKSIDIIVDWTNVPNTSFWALRAAVVAQGRAITIMEEVHPEKKLANRRVQDKFLESLKRKIPDDCDVCVLTDAGFHNDWFRKVTSLGWHYIGRVRHGSQKKYCAEKGKSWKTLEHLSSEAKTSPLFIGLVWLCKSNCLLTHLYTYKSQNKGRKSLNRAGKRKKDTGSLEYGRAAREAWILASSLPPEKCRPIEVVKRYFNRMQIEEGFRDLKSSKYGFGLEHCLTRKIDRFKIILLLAMIAAYYAWIIGFLAEINKLQYDYQSNSIKTRRSLSFFFLGCEIIRGEKDISIILRAIAHEESTHDQQDC